MPSGLSKIHYNRRVSSPNQKVARYFQVTWLKNKAFRSKSFRKILFYTRELLPPSVMDTEHTPNALLRRHRVDKRTTVEKESTNGGAANPLDKFTPSRWTPPRQRSSVHCSLLFAQHPGGPWHRREAFHKVLLAEGQESSSDLPELMTLFLLNTLSLFHKGLMLPIMAPESLANCKLSARRGQLSFGLVSSAR